MPSSEIGRGECVQGYLAHKQRSTPLGPYGKRQGPRGVRFLVSEVPLYAVLEDFEWGIQIRTESIAESGFGKPRARFLPYRGVAYRGTSLRGKAPPFLRTTVGAQAYP